MEETTIIDLAAAREGRPVEPKRVEGNQKNAMLLNDAMVCLTSFQNTGLLLFLDQAKNSLDKLVEIGHA